MPFHVKSVGPMGTGTVYYRDGEVWTQVYADRKQYSSKSDADALAATQITRVTGGKTYTYQPDIYKNSTVVTE